MMLDVLGHCGRPAPGLLPILVGEPAESCPTAAMLDDPELGVLAEMVPTPHGPGALSTVPRHHLPADLREFLDEAQGWLSEYRRRMDADWMHEAAEMGIPPDRALALRRMG